MSTSRSSTPTPIFPEILRVHALQELDKAKATLSTTDSRASTLAIATVLAGLQNIIEENNTLKERVRHLESENTALRMQLNQSHSGRDQIVVTPEMMKQTTSTQELLDFTARLVDARARESQLQRRTSRSSNDETPLPRPAKRHRTATPLLPPNQFCPLSFSPLPSPSASLSPFHVEGATHTPVQSPSPALVNSSFTSELSAVETTQDPYDWQQFFQPEKTD